MVTLKCVRYSSLATSLSQNEQVVEMAAKEMGVGELSCSLNGSLNGSCCGKWRLGMASLDKWVLRSFEPLTAKVSGGKCLEQIRYSVLRFSIGKLHKFSHSLRISISLGNLWILSLEGPHPGTLQVRERFGVSSLI